MKKKAFTLTELLVVVVIIGVLAAVVLPKFTQVLETRRTTEAEEIMRAVRSEQEARCTLDKNYVGEVDKAELASFPANEGNNYHYTLTATGIAAASRNKNYTLRIQSYRDGEICCDGDDCAHLGKTYPVCPARVVAVDECAAETACNLRSYSEACPSGQEGQVLFVPNADCTGYEQVNQCHDITVDPTTCSEGETRNVTSNCTGSSGERCEGGTWKHFASTDDGTPQPGDTTKTCPTGDTVTCTYTCNDTTGVWDKTCDECRICQEGKEEITSSACGKKSGKRCVNNEWVSFTDEATDITAEEKASCACETQPPDETQECPEGTGTQTRSYECNSSTGKYEAGEWTGECTIEGECNLSYTELTSYTGEDTCDGNNEEQYAGVPPNHESCYDIYYNPGTQTTTAGCPRSCKRSCPSGQTCRCVPHPVAGNPAGYYTEECTGNNYFPGGQTGVGTGGTAVTFGRDYYRLIECQ